MKDITKIRDWLLENAVDESGDLMLDKLDFSDFDGDVYINSMKVKGTLFQSNHEVQGNLSQSWHEVKGDLYNRNNKYGGELHEEPSTKLAKLGYRLKEEN